MADDIVDRLSETLASGLPRRQALKRVGGIVAAAALGITTGTSVEATNKKSGGRTKVIRRVGLQATLESGSRTLLMIPDGRAGGITHKGESFTIVPQISNDGERAELAVYKGRKVNGSPLRTLNLKLGRAVATPLELESLPVAGLAALWAGAAEVPEDYTFGDCTVTCTCPPFLTISACAVCCNVGQESCGYCDGDCTHNCTPPGE